MYHQEVASQDDEDAIAQWILLVTFIVQSLITFIDDY